MDAFYAAAAAALARAERSGQVPERFSDEGMRRWAQFANELTLADLLDLAVRDATAAYPVPFGLRETLPGHGNGAVGLTAGQAEAFMREAEAQVGLPPEAYLRIQAEHLGVTLPDGDALAGLPQPEPHHLVLELPGAGGWLSFVVASRRDARVYFWENFVVTCASWREMMLAGLIALELSAPPRRTLPIHLDESLQGALTGRRYDWVVGLKERHSHLALSGFVPETGRVVLI